MLMPTKASQQSPASVHWEALLHSVLALSQDDQNVEPNIENIQYSAHAVKTLLRHGAAPNLVNWDYCYRMDDYLVFYPLLRDLTSLHHYASRDYLLGGVRSTLREWKRCRSRAIADLNLVQELALTPRPDYGALRLYAQLAIKPKRRRAPVQAPSSLFPQELTSDQRHDAFDTMRYYTTILGDWRVVEGMPSSGSPVREVN